MAVGVPAPLRHSVWWLSAGSGLGIVAFVVATALDSMIIANSAGLVASVVFGVIMVVGAIWAVAAAAAARLGRLVWAHLARAGGAILLVGHWLAVSQEAETAVISLGRYAAADDVPAEVGVALLVFGVGGIVATLIGLAGFADPRSERYIREIHATRDTPWESWGRWPGTVRVQIVAPQMPPKPSGADGWTLP